MAFECRGNQSTGSIVFFSLFIFLHTLIQIYLIWLILIPSFFCAYEGKTSWPELLGVEKEVAKETVERENPYVTDVEIVLEGTIIPADVVPVCTRVRIGVEESGIVTRVPVVG